MINIVNKEKCSGCHACESACPKQCIKMESDTEGFLYPVVDMSECISCGFCEKVCPIINKQIVHEKKHEIIAYAAYNQDEDIRLKSSSGGVFYLLAKTIVEKKGVVFGARFDSNFVVRHGYTETLEGIQEFQGSKYVQSDVGSSYKQVDIFLKQGRLVLFTGTPCQIGGLYAYLGKSYDNLYCQDIICHGVPSPMVWKKYVDYREEKAASKTWRIFFRHKKYGWKIYSVLFAFANNTEYIQNLSKDLYLRGFLTNLYLRPSCYNCAFKDKYRQSDITLADFWGIQNIAPDMHDDKGTSLVIVHSDKGKELFDDVQEKIKWVQVDIDSAFSYNPSVMESVKKPQNRDLFFKIMNERGLEFALNKLCREKLIIRIKHFVFRLLSKVKLFILRRKS